MALFFVKKIWQNEVDDSVRSQFMRFSRGTFGNKFVTNISRNGKCKVTSTFELANNLVCFLFSLVPKAKVSGVLLCKANPEPILKSLGIATPTRKKSALFQSEIDGELSREQISKIAEEAYFMLFSCEADGILLKMKPKLPQPSKSGSEKVNDKFCTLEADIRYFEKIKEEFAFDAADFKKARISHDIEIREIILPKDKKDFEKIRLLAKRKGKMIRKITADGKESINEKDFLI